ncbi:replication-relaxation family protein [Terribacillus saccharophilus]|uniref:replication-relaxation family protein n=1 Tax=Terribacillus saccharophilus TaxID=361277 RepID=UPI0039826CD3
MNVQSERFRKRTEEILLRLARFEYATRPMMQDALNLGGERNANRILGRLESDNLIRSFRREKKVYTLTKKGAGMIGIDDLKHSREPYVHHILLRGQAWLDLGRPASWQVEQPIKFARYRIVPDAMYTDNIRHHFVEIDRTQRMTVNREKLKAYALLQHLHRQGSKEPPAVHYVTISETRAKKLRKMAEEEKALILISVAD